MERTEDEALVQGGYDAVYGSLLRSPTLREIWRRHALDPGYPEGFENISFVTSGELARLASALDTARGQEIADLGCGQGGPGLWVAREIGARLQGIDLSPVAVSHATQRAESLGLADIATFSTGTFDRTGLNDGSAHATVSFDALQYAPDKEAVAQEVHRILVPGGRFAFTAFELDPDRMSDLPVIGTDPTQDYRSILSRAGFTIETYEETSAWQTRLTNAYQAIVENHDTLIREMTDEAAAPLTMEVTLTLEHHPYRRRVLAIATRS
jgi:ubiquinone/menaquinone biosynthesis C-methylase UbiE